MNLDKALSEKIAEDFTKNGVDPDGLAATAHRFIMANWRAMSRLQTKNARRGKKLSAIQTLVQKVPFAQRSATEQRILDIIFDNVIGYDNE